MTIGTRSGYTKYPHIIHVYCTIRLNGCFCRYFVCSKTLERTFQGGFNHPRVGNDYVQSTAKLGLG